MTRFSILLVCLPALGLLCGTAPASAPRTQTVATGAGLTLVVPAGWRRVGLSDNRLLLLSPGPGEEGVVIARHQAMILAMPVEGWQTGGDLESTIRGGLGDDRLIARRSLRLGRTARDCPVVEEVDTASEVAPGAEQINTIFYCVARGKAVLVQLTHWPRDPSRLRFRAVALKVIRSLRVSG